MSGDFGDGEFRIFIADERELIANAIEVCLRGHATLIAAAARYSSMVELVPQVLPDVLVLHETLPGLSLVELEAWIRTLPHAPMGLVVLLNNETRPGVQDNWPPGCRTVGPNEGIGQIIAAMNDTLRAEGSRRPLISPRQTEILTLVAEGDTNIQIGHTLGIAVGTVKRHLADVFLRLDVQSRIEALNRARQLGALPQRPGTPKSRRTHTESAPLT